MTMERTFLLFLLEVTAKATTVVGVAGLVCWMLGRASAAVRHFIWVAAIVGVLVLPVLTLVLPKWDVHFPPLKSRATAAVGVPAVKREAVRAELAPPDRPAKAGPYATQSDRGPAKAGAYVARTVPLNISPIATAPDPLTTLPLHEIRTSPDHQITTSPVSTPFLLVLWSLGATIALCRFFAGHLRLWWIGRHTDPITDPTWIDLSRRVAHQLRLSTRSEGGAPLVKEVRLLRCRRPTMPVCWGVRRPSLLLPSDADTWTVERRKIVLLHELAHAKRRDCLTQAIGQLAIAMHWFNPLVWLAVRRLRAEQERACDDLVLAAGASAPDYADHLLDIARAFCSVGCPSWAAVAMARPSQLEGRLVAILDRRRNRAALTRRARAAAATFACATVGTLAAVQPAPAPAPTDAHSSSQAVSKSRPHPTPADASGTATEAILPTFDGQPLPMPAPRPIIVPQVDLIELEDLEFELQGLIEGVGEGIGGVVGGVMGGVGSMKIDAEQWALQAQDAEWIAKETLLDINAEKIAIEAMEQALPQIAYAEKRDDRPEADPRIVAALATALKDQSADVRRQAAVTLSQMRSAQAVDALIAASTDADQEVRKSAVRAISRHKSDAVTQALVRALKDSDAEVRRSAMHGVARLRDPKYIDVFVEALKDADPEVRQQAAQALSQYRDPRAVPGLIIALEDANADVRQQAAHALGQVGDARAVDPLVAAMKDPNADVREHVVHALGRIGQRSGREKGRE